MFVSQLSVFIENTPGALARVTKLLADNKVDIRAMSLAEMPDFGVLRLIVNDNATAGRVLGENNFIYRFTDVIATPMRSASSPFRYLLFFFPFSLHW